jgi:cytochrome b561
MPEPRYTIIAIALHWLVAVAVTSGFALGLYMVDLPFSPQKLSFYSYHKWIGVSVFAFVLVRIAWRLAHPPPPLPDTVPRLQVAASRAVHFLLYACLLAGPLSGWLYSSATGVPTVPFGIPALQLPDLVDKDRELASTLKFVHMTVVFFLASLVAVHVAAVIKHHLLDRTAILRRMLPGGSA